MQDTLTAAEAAKPLTLLEMLREKTEALHTKAERTGFIVDILKGRVSPADYALFLRSLLPAYRALENALARHGETSLLGPIVRPELNRSAAIEADLRQLVPDTAIADIALLPEARAYEKAVVEAGQGDGARLVAHAYARYLGDLSGGQILKRLLMKSPGLPPEALSFYDFPAISDHAAFKAEYRGAIIAIGDRIDDPEAVAEEGARAFELNIALSLALQARIGANQTVS